MTKHIILFFAALCSLHNHANAAPSDSDTVRYESFSNGIEMLRPMQPSYLDGVVVPTRKSGNWFVSLSGGASAFLGTPLGCEDLFGRLKPSYTIGVGKWFTPSVGVRVNYSGLHFKDSQLSTQEYHHVHADLMWNLFGNRYAKQDEVRWGLSPYAGLGLLHNADNGHNPLAISYGIQGQYRISRRVSVLMELSGTTTFQDFDGYGKANRLGDHMLSLTAGFSFSIGKVGWKRAVDHRPYERRNEWLTGYANTLTERNRQYAGKLDKERRTLDELKKILEIEGLLDTYGHLFNDKDDDGRKFPRKQLQRAEHTPCSVKESPLERQFAFYSRSGHRHYTRLGDRQYLQSRSGQHFRNAEHASQSFRYHFCGRLFRPHAAWRRMYRLSGLFLL